MIDPKIFDEVSAKLANLLPPGMAEIRTDFEKNARASMQSMFAKMDLVSREEFDVQAAVLQRTREKLEAMEKTLTLLETQLQPPSKTPKPAKKTKT